MRGGRNKAADTAAIQRVSWIAEFKDFWRLPPQSAYRLFLCVLCGKIFFGGLRPRPGKIFGFVAVRVRVVGQGSSTLPAEAAGYLDDCFLFFPVPLFSCLFDVYIF